MNSERFEVFLSHSRKDKALVEFLFQTCKLNNVTAWYDDEDFNRGDELNETLESAIKSSVRFLCLWSAHVPNSFAETEMDFALDHKESGGEIILHLVQIDGTPVPSKWQKYLYEKDVFDDSGRFLTVGILSDILGIKPMLWAQLQGVLNPVINADFGADSYTLARQGLFSLLEDLGILKAQLHQLVSMGHADEIIRNLQSVLDDLPLSESPLISPQSLKLRTPTTHQAIHQVAMRIPPRVGLDPENSKGISVESSGTEMSSTINFRDRETGELIAGPGPLSPGGYIEFDAEL